MEEKENSNMVTNEKALKNLSLKDIDAFLDDSDSYFQNGDTEKEAATKMLQHLNPESKEFLIREKIRRAVRRFGEDGLTASEVAELTGIGQKSVYTHLKVLTSLREVYAQKKTKNLKLYFPNGKPLHTVGTMRLDWDDTDWKSNPIFEINLMQGVKDRLFFHILEKKYSILEGETPEGAIMVPLDHLDDFIDSLVKLREKVGGHEHGTTQ